MFSKLFILFGNIFKSKNIIVKNLEKIIPNLDDNVKENLINKMWSNYGKTFIEYAHLNSFKKVLIILKLKI